MKLAYLVPFYVVESEQGEVDEESVGTPVGLHHRVDGGLQSPPALLSLTQQLMELLQTLVLPVSFLVP